MGTDLKPGQRVDAWSGPEAASEGEAAVNYLTSTQAEFVERDFWMKLRRLAGRLPFAGDLLTAYYTATDPLTPVRVRAILLGALAYFVVPADLIPDIVIGLGYTDDAAVLAAALKTLVGHIQPKHRTRAHETLRHLKQD